MSDYVIYRGRFLSYEYLLKQFIVLQKMSEENIPLGSASFDGIKNRILSEVDSSFPEQNLVDFIQNAVENNDFNLTTFRSEIESQFPEKAEKMISCVKNYLLNPTDDKIESEKDSKSEKSSSKKRKSRSRSYSSSESDSDSYDERRRRRRRKHHRHHKHHKRHHKSRSRYSDTDDESDQPDIEKERPRPQSPQQTPSKGEEAPQYNQTNKEKDNDDNDESTIQNDNYTLSKEEREQIKKTARIIYEMFNTGNFTEGAKPKRPKHNTIERKSHRRDPEDRSDPYAYPDDQSYHDSLPSSGRSYDMNRSSPYYPQQSYHMSPYGDQGKYPSQSPNQYQQYNDRGPRFSYHDDYRKNKYYDDLNDRMDQRRRDDYDPRRGNDRDYY